MFLRCSGVDGREEGGEEGARVGEDAASEGAGKEAGSNSRSGMGGEIKGLLVILSKSKRRTALRVD